VVIIKVVILSLWLQINIVGVDIWGEFRPGQLQDSSRSRRSRPWSTESGSDVSRTQVRWYTTAKSREAFLCQGAQPG